MNYATWHFQYKFIIKTENLILAHFRPIFGSFLADFRFRAEVKKVTSRAELSRAEPS